MSEKCYKVQFTAHLHKLTLALKMNCRIQVIWKRGQKTCESGKFVLESGTANFDKKISINCNMIYDTKTKLFTEKITKFSIVLSSDRGTKQAGQILFNVAQYINEKQLNKKIYQMNLDKCPDKNAKLFFTLSGVLLEEISADNISQSSYSQSLLSDKSRVEGISNSMIIPNQSKLSKSNVKSKDGSKQIERQSKQKTAVESKQKMTKIEQQNVKIREQIKRMQKIKKQNEQLRKVIKNEQFKKVKEIKEKMDKMKDQIEKMKAEIKSNKNLEAQIKKTEGQILNCKIKIMKALNFCAQYGGSQLLDSVQSYCGMHQ